jgi:hypothetical protein
MGNWLTNNWLLISGLICIFAAIVGGGFKAFGIELPALQSWKRQAILAIFGVVLVIAGIYSPSLGPEVELYDTKNNDAVFPPGFPPPQPAVFSIPQPYHITYIWNYHWANGVGVTPGNISLRRSDGKVFGPWEVTAADLEARINWIAKPDTEIPAGTYTIIDSENENWSWNAASKRQGMSKVKGSPVRLGYWVIDLT